uniref:MORN repeat-containing protein 5 n=1 Tax=Glossina brevipalpis TaxID=37001 RepID=A0A1A9W0M0_9MUSC
MAKMRSIAYERSMQHNYMTKAPPAANRKPNYQYFLTGSNFSGSWSETLHTMDGYGLYTFPDGSEYRGYFAKGLFHGYGLLHLMEPYGITFKGVFVDGHLSDMLEMWFDDDLHLEADFKGWNADFQKWRYCSAKDRRYVVEQLEGLTAVGPKPHKRVGKANYIPTKLYDVGEGLFNPATNMIINRPRPFFPYHYASCEDRDRITQDCLSGTPLTIKDIPLETCRRIIEFNLTSAEELKEMPPSCNYNPVKERKRFLKGIRRAFGQKSEELLEDSGKSEASACIGTLKDISTSSCSSYTAESLIVDREEQLEATREYDNVLWGQRPQTPSLLVFHEI